MEKLNNTAKVLEELHNSLDVITNDELTLVSNDIENMKSIVTMAMAFTDNLGKFDRQNDVLAGYQVMLSVLDGLDKKVCDTIENLFKANLQLRDIM